MPSTEAPASSRRERLDRAILVLCMVTLLGCCGLSLQAAWRWPLVGDSALIRYVVFLLGRGKAPYSQIVDINLPGSYLLEYLAMKCFGWDALGLRFYDGFLCLLFCIFAYRAGGSRIRDTLYCLAGGLLFVLIHLQDGLTEAGQRDLAMTVLLLGGVVLLIRSAQLSPLTLFFFELLAGFALTVKPTLLPMALLPVLLCKAGLRRNAPSALRLAGAGAAGFAIAPAAAAVWLWQAGSMHAFLQTMLSLGALHSELGRKSLWFLAAHGTAPVTILFVLWLGLLVAGAGVFDPGRKLLCGLLSYFEQGKGLSYQRYPFLGLGIVLISLDISRVAARRGAAYFISLAAVGCVTLWFAPRFTVLVLSFDHSAPFEAHLEERLQASAAGGAATGEAATVQCLDTFGGCINTLYDMRAVQATGYLYDCYLFSPPSAAREMYRQAFLRSFDQARPDTIVLTNQPCFDPAKNYDRLRSWPAFDNQLERDYRLESEWQTNQQYRWWSRWEPPIAFRVYALR
jgi:hypothetical protein